MTSELVMDRELRVHRLQIPGLIDPMWLHACRSGQHASEVEPGGLTVRLQGKLLVIDDGPLEPDLPIRLWLGSDGYFVCAAESELQERDRTRAQDQALQQQAKRETLNQLRDAAKAFNGRIQLPVRWDVGVKDVLSGLSERSWGDGRNRRTVNHILLQEPLQHNRLRRAEGDFLCTSKDGSNGWRGSGSAVASATDGDGGTHQPQVTCKTCLALAGHWTQEKPE
jgi:hypothetical protein